MNVVQTHNEAKETSLYLNGNGNKTILVPLANSKIRWQHENVFEGQ